MGGSHAIQLFFGGVSIIGFFFALLFLPETHKKKLSEIQDHFNGVNKLKKSNAVDKRKTGNSINNRKPKVAVKLETVKEAEKMIKETENA